jgi:hypothetical protein
MNDETELISVEEDNGALVPVEDTGGWDKAIPFTQDHADKLEEIHKLLTEFKTLVTNAAPMLESLAPMLGGLGIRL